MNIFVSGMKKKLYTGDIVILTAIALICVIMCYFVYFSNGTTKSTYVIASLDGEEIATFDLTKDTTAEIGNSSVFLTIENEKAYISKSDCPDKLCIHLGFLSKDSKKSLVCLPNRVSISISQNENDSEVDILAG